MMDWAFEKDRGFRHYRLAETLGAFVRLRRQDFEIDDQGFDALAEFYAELRAELIRRTVDGEA
jgi:ribosomal protein L13E